MSKLHLVVFLLALGIAAAPAVAVAQSGQSQTDKLGCELPSSHSSATPPAHGPSSGTHPGGSGSTGWSGGGSNIGTTPQSPTPASPTEHPATVQGLDPKPNEAQRPTC